MFSVAGHSEEIGQITPSLLMGHQNPTFGEYLSIRKAVKVPKFVYVSLSFSAPPQDHPGHFILEK